MALQMDHTFAGVLVSNAYHKINYISGNKDQLHVDVVISKDATEDAAANHLDSFSMVIDGADLAHDDGANDKNYTKQVYEHMKANIVTDVEGGNRDYTGAVDV